MLPYQIVCGFCFINNFFFPVCGNCNKDKYHIQLFSRAPTQLGRLSLSMRSCSSFLADIASIQLHMVKCTAGGSQHLILGPWASFHLWIEQRWEIANQGSVHKEDLSFAGQGTDSLGKGAMHLGLTYPTGNENTPWRLWYSQMPGQFSWSSSLPNALLLSVWFHLRQVRQKAYNRMSLIFKHKPGKDDNINGIKMFQEKIY